MTEVKSVNAPAIGEEGLKRLYAFVRRTPLHSQSTLFDAGYEQAKADFKERLEREATLPDQPRSLRQHAMQGELIPVDPPKPRSWWSW